MPNVVQRLADGFDCPLARGHGAPHAQGDERELDQHERPAARLLQRVDEAYVREEPDACRRSAQRHDGNWGRRDAGSSTDAVDEDHGSPFLSARSASQRALLRPHG